MDYKIIVFLLSITGFIFAIFFISLSRGEKKTSIAEFQESERNSYKSKRKGIYGKISILVIIILIFAGFFRIYYGGGIGIRIVSKHSFSFKDTVVNLDDILGISRIVVATKHPAVKKQLEEMGVVKTDEQSRKRLMNGIERETERLRRELGF